MTWVTEYKRRMNQGDHLGAMEIAADNKDDARFDYARDENRKWIEREVNQNVFTRNKWWLITAGAVVVILLCVLVLSLDEVYILM